MGASLAKAAAVLFARLPGNEYKALMHMCLRALDKPNKKTSKLFPDGHPAALWYASWEDLALATGSEIPTDPKRRDSLRRRIADLRQALVSSGAIEEVPHPANATAKAYRLVLTPNESWAESADVKRAKRGANNPTGRGPIRVPGDGRDGGQIGSPDGGQFGSREMDEPGANLGPGRGPNWVPPYRGTKRNQEGEDLPEDPSTRRGAQPSVATAQGAPAGLLEATDETDPVPAGAAGRALAYASSRAASGAASRGRAARLDRKWPSAEDCRHWNDRTDESAVTADGTCLNPNCTARDICDGCVRMARLDGSIDRCTEHREAG